MSSKMAAYKGEPCEWTWEELQDKKVAPPFRPTLVRLVESGGVCVVDSFPTEELQTGSNTEIQY